MIRSFYSIKIFYARILFDISKKNRYILSSNTEIKLNLKNLMLIIYFIYKFVVINTNTHI